MLLAELHIKHIGMSRMKVLARSYIWWPQLNSNIEETCCHKCNECLMLSDNPVAAPLHQWLVLKQPWERIHIDHATWGKNLLFVITDFFQMARSLSSKFNFSTADHCEALSRNLPPMDFPSL